MKTIEKLCRKFERLFPSYCADFDTINSYKGCYRICIIDVERNLYSWHIFTSCKDFSEWINGVVLE